jgi:hypothetical protein
MFLRLASHHREAFSIMRGGWNATDITRRMSVKLLFLIQHLIERCDSRMRRKLDSLENTIQSWRLPLSRVA